MFAGEKRSSRWETQEADSLPAINLTLLCLRQVIVLESSFQELALGVQNTCIANLEERLSLSWEYMQNKGRERYLVL